MDILNKDEIKKLSGNEKYPSVSIFIPTHKEWNETHKDMTRYKNQLTKAEKILVKIMREKELNNFLKPAKDLLDNPDFWNHQDNGLAVYFNKDEFKTYKLPERVEEFLFVNSSYYIKPLLPVITGNGKFFLLAFDQKKTRLFEYTKYTINELKIPDTMISLDEMLKFYDTERSLQFHSGIRQANSIGKGPNRGAIFHGQGTGSDETEHKKNLLDFARIINTGIHKLLKDETAPLIITAVEYLIPIYSKANSYPHLYEKHLQLNAEEFAEQKLQEKAWKLVKSVFERESKKAFGKYEQFSGNGKATSSIEDIIKASLNNKIEYLWVDINEPIWGKFIEHENEVEYDGKLTDRNKDLLDFAAAKTILNNGTVYALKRNEMPVQKPALAVFRF
ncbi:MAG TPA: hypothetical protein VLN45_04380 [Ignavibacteriaceae bacterium]|nr:hypothetical protein [Ignavibacteriaceae bacterium]